MDNTNHTEPKTTAPMRDLNEDELRCVAGGDSWTWAAILKTRAEMGALVATMGIGGTSPCRALTFGRGSVGRPIITERRLVAAPFAFA